MAEGGGGGGGGDGMEETRKMQHDIMEHSADLQNRDPKGINKHIRVTFHDIFAEPEPGLHSIDCVWVNAFKVFELTKLFWYRVLTIVCGLPVALCCGCSFACLSFQYIWCCQPGIRQFRIVIRYVAEIWRTIAYLLIRPCAYAVGSCWSSIRVHKSQGDVIKEEDLHIV